MPVLHSALESLLGHPWTPPVAGSTLGHYLLLEAIGQGEFAIVWRAEDQRSNTTAALKIFTPDSFPEAERREAAVRFYEGAAAMRKLASSPLIVRLYEGPFFEGCFLWFAMEYFPDGDLSKALQGRTLATVDKTQIVEDLIGAVAFAHAHGIRHRDIRPANVLLRREVGGSRAVLADFDIAYHDHVLRARASTVAHRGVVRYTPPEIFGASFADMKQLLRRYENDCYALCVVVFDLFSYEATLPPQRTAKALFQALKNNSQLDTATRRRIARFCAGGLGTDGGGRYTHLKDLRACWTINPSRFSPRLVVVFSVLGVALFGALGLSRSNDAASVLRRVGDLKTADGTPLLPSLASRARAPRDARDDESEGSPILPPEDAGTDSGPQCELPAFEQGAARRYVASCENDAAADFVRRRLAQLVALEPHGAVWTTALHHYEKTIRKRKRWVVTVESTTPATSDAFCTWLIVCKGWTEFCAAEVPDVESGTQTPAVQLQRGTAFEPPLVGRVKTPAHEPAVVRTAPVIDAPRMGYAPDGAMVSLLGHSFNKQWFLIRLGSQAGWIHGDIVSRSSTSPGRLQPAASEPSTTGAQ